MVGPSAAASPGREPLLRVHVLGSAGALPGADRDTTALAVRAPDGWSLVECPGGVVHKLARLGVAPSELRRMILTHDHVDHLYGLPHLIHAQFCARQTGTLTLHAPSRALRTVAAVVSAHDLRGPAYPRLDLREIPLREGAEVAADSGLRILATPVEHGRPTVAVRFEAGGVATCYSSDTGPCQALVALARDVDLLLHDCAGPHADKEEFGPNHSSALEAAEIAAAAGAGRLVLIHLGPWARRRPEAVLEEARAAFPGPVGLAADGDLYRLPGDRGGDGPGTT